MDLNFYKEFGIEEETITKKAPTCPKEVLSSLGQRPRLSIF
jgi:hypothetical protein